jgi:hypothetical protein
VLADAWSLPFKNELDLISSNGLTFYVADDDRVVDLFKGFHAALKVLLVQSYAPNLCPAHSS